MAKKRCKHTDRQADRQTDSITPNKVKTLVTSDLTDEEASVSVVYCHQIQGFI